MTLYFFSLVTLFLLATRGAAGTREKPVQIDRSLYDLFVIYSNYSSASTIHPCPVPPYNSNIIDYVNVHPTTTQAVFFKDAAAQQIIIAFPGTNGSEDVHLDEMQNLVPYHSLGIRKGDCDKCHTHQGFLKAWNSASHRVAAALRQAMKNNPSYSIVITGHSLGAALASLATASLRGLGFPILATYTFGQPRTGDPAYAAYINKISNAGHGRRGTMHRVTHANDGVVHEPPRSLGYRHHLTEYWERNTKSGGQAARRTFRCFGEESPYCCDGTNPGKESFLGGNAAHREYSGVSFSNDKPCGGS